MILPSQPQRPASLRNRAFSLVEVMFATSIVAVAFVSLYAAITSGFALVVNARENLRATQLMVERAEVMRLYTWAQITNTGYIPTTFTASYYPPIGTTNDQSSAITNGGTVYYGTVSIDAASVASGYADQMRLVTITLNWTNGTSGHQRSLQTFVSANGLQKYVY